MDADVSSPIANPHARAEIGIVEYGFWTFLVVAVGRIGELVPGLSAIPLAKLSIGLALLSLFRKWKDRPRITESVRPIASTIRWLFVLMVILCPFSIWQGSSFHFLTQVLPILIATVLVGYYMSHTWRSIRGSLFALVISGIVLVRAALAGYTGGRAAAATMYDTNDLAYVLVIVLPLVIGFAITARSTMKRLLYVAIAISFLVGVLLTQSRGGLLGLLAAAFLMTVLPTSPPRVSDSGKQIARNRRISAIIAVAIVGVIVWPQLPESTRARLATIVDLGNDYNLDPNDINGRSRIWARGWQAALARPIGYGPDSFPIVDYKYGGKFNTAHNSLILVLVETGFIGLFLFLKVYVLAWRRLGRLRRDLLALPSLSLEGKERYVFAGLMQCSLAASLVAGFFLSMAWVTLLWAIFALCMAMVSCDTEISSPEAQSA